MLCLLPPVVLAMAVRAEMRADIRSAMRHAGMSEKEAAITLNVSQGLLSRKLSGEKPLTFESLEGLPAIFWQWFAVLMAQRHGVPALVGTGARLSRRQARMGMAVQKVGVA